MPIHNTKKYPGFSRGNSVCIVGISCQPCYLVGEEEPVSPAFLGVEAGVEAGVGVGVPFPRVLAIISSILYSKSWPQSRFLLNNLYSW